MSIKIKEFFLKTRGCLSAVLFHKHRVERADEHEQCGAGDVEVGEQGVHDFELARRVDEDFCAAFASDDLPVMLRGDTFQHPHTRCADGDDAAVLTLGGVYCARGGVADGVAFFVHLVRGEVGGVDARESSEADVQRDETNFNAECADFFQQLGCEMQTGGGRGDGAERLRIDGLVAVQIFRLLGVAADVGRQGDFPEGVEFVQNVFGAGEV